MHGSRAGYTTIKCEGQGLTVKSQGVWRMSDDEGLRGSMTDAKTARYQLMAITSAYAGKLIGRMCKWEKR